MKTSTLHNTLIPIIIIIQIIYRHSNRLQRRNVAQLLCILRTSSPVSLHLLTERHKSFEIIIILIIRKLTIALSRHLSPEGWTSTTAQSTERCCSSSDGHWRCKCMSQVLCRLYRLRQRVEFTDATLVNKCCLGMLPGTWLTTAASSQTFAQDFARQTLVRGPISATDPSMQLDLESRTMYRQISDSRSCHTFRSRLSLDTFFISTVPPLPLNYALEVLLPTKGKERKVDLYSANRQYLDH